MKGNSMSVRWVIVLFLALIILAEKAHAKSETLVEHGKRMCEEAGVPLADCTALPPALRSGEEAAVILPEVYASRDFAGPNEFPPEDFAAYGILAFETGYKARTRERREMICEAYFAAIPLTDDLVERDVPIDVQMVTVWPVKAGDHLDDINQLEVGPACETAVRHYDQIVALEAMKHARKAGVEFEGIGPFLLAWSPAQKKGEEDAVVLTLNLSKIRRPEQADRLMKLWRNEIERRPERWRNGWKNEGLLIAIRDFADDFGEGILSIF